MPDAAAFRAVIDGVDDALAHMAGAVPQPRLVPTPTGHLSYRYVEQTIEQAMVLKTVRLVGALRALFLLISNGLALDAGAAMRIVDELETDIMFLAGPATTGSAQEKRHADYLAELFQEEFDHPDPLQATQARQRVARRDIRAYVARTYAPIAGVPIDQLSRVSASVETAVSGYVHGAAVHILDVYDGSRFITPLRQTDAPLQALERQFPGYLFRATTAVVFAVRALGLLPAAAALYAVADKIPGIDGVNEDID